MMDHLLDIIVLAGIVPTPRLIQTIHHLNPSIQRHLLKRNLSRNLRRVNIQKFQPFALSGQFLGEDGRGNVGGGSHGEDFGVWMGGLELGVDACDEGLRVCDGEGGAEGSFCPAFYGEEDGVFGGAGVEIVHPGFDGV